MVLLDCHPLVRWPLPSNAPRVASGPARAQDRRQSGGPGVDRPEPLRPRPLVPQHAVPLTSHTPAQGIDIGFSAPIASAGDRRNLTLRPLGGAPKPLGRPPPSKLAQSQSMPSFDRAPIAQPTGARPPSRPNSRSASPAVAPRPDTLQRPGAMMSGGLGTTDAGPKPPPKEMGASATRPVSKTSALATAAQSPGKGPQTFEQMGVPVAKDNSECNSRNPFTPERKPLSLVDRGATKLAPGLSGRASAMERFFAR
ncbi:hypothetical protein LTR28_007503 [Elasticomyces elasticus]|nr:hypothetical protein LTR28_007503 [Elasticomyces elasticus]